MKYERLLPTKLFKVQRGSTILAAAAPTLIQTQVGPFWRNDGTDDQVPLPSSS